MNHACRWKGREFVCVRLLKVEVSVTVYGWVRYGYWVAFCLFAKDNLGPKFFLRLFFLALLNLPIFVQLSGVACIGEILPYSPVADRRGTM
jgi:hypothetical protein